MWTTFSRMPARPLQTEVHPGIAQTGEKDEPDAVPENRGTGAALSHRLDHIGPTHRQTTGGERNAATSRCAAGR